MEEVMPDTRQPVPNERVEEFVRLLGQYQRRLFLYVLSLVPRWNDAEEVMQETHLVLWREFERFEIGSNFLAWASRVAFHQVLAWRKRRQRDRLQLSDAVLELVVEEATRDADALEERAAALTGCIEKLPDQQRDLLRLRYTNELSIEEVARRAGRTVEAAYRALSRIRQTLHECVSRSLLQEGHP
jgi:RNA polymerase sigma-70 factor, ECF subfamily